LKFSNPIDEILSDNKSGSAELLRKINEFLLNKFSEGLSIEKDLKKISNRFTEFQNIRSYIDELISLPESQIMQYLIDFEPNSITKFELIYEGFSHLVYDNTTIVTLSNSKTILEVLKFASVKRSNLRVIISESRPVNEGSVFAEELAKSGINTTLITEAMIPNYVEESDFSLIGADKLLNDGSVINKTGSRLLAIVSKYFNKPFYVAADKTKKSSNNDFVQTPHPKEEIYSSNSRKVNIAENLYFERIEAELITEIFTD
jgi:translation initiation factor 2B subunit (eIF-2B alpha/beta/delta family)